MKKSEIDTKISLLYKKWEDIVNGVVPNPQNVSISERVAPIQDELEYLKNLTPSNSLGY